MSNDTIARLDKIIQLQAENDQNINAAFSAYESSLAAAQAEIERLRGLFKIDGEQHDSFIKRLTGDHETRVARYADALATERATVATLTARVTGLEAGIASACEIGVGPHKLPNSTVKRIHTALRALLQKDKTNG